MKTKLGTLDEKVSVIFSSSVASAPFSPFYSSATPIMPMLNFLPYLIYI